MPETLAATYKLLDAAEQKEVMDFVYFVISRRKAGSHEKASNDRIAALQKYGGSCRGVWDTDALSYQNDLREEREIG